MNLLEAIDLLNSWVRSDSHWGWSFRTSPRYAIYDWKNAVIEAAIREGKCNSEAIRLMVNCRDCSGTGKYMDSYGQRFDHCWKCYNTGKQMLEFVVSTIEGFIWHTPRGKSWRFKLPGDFWAKSSLSMDWVPNKKGKNLEDWQVVECLNICEEAVLSGELPKPSGHSVYESGDYYGYSEHGQYGIYLGERAKACDFCGRDPNEHRYGVSRGRVGWSAWACETCRAKFATASQWSDVLNKYVPLGGNGKSIFDEFIFPAELCQHAEIDKWLERHHVGAALKGGLSK